jgi:integrase
MKKNSISCYMRALRAIYNQAVDKGLSEQKNPFREVYTGIDKTIKRAVNEEVITLLKNLDLSRKKALEKTRDVFMFSFYMRGMSFVDMANLRQSAIKDGYITYSRSKTKQILTIKVEKCIEEIITRYQDQTIADYLLPIYNERNYNHDSHLRTYNKRLKRISGMLKLEKPLSSYDSRHSWATLALHRGVPVEIISESMGHENENTTRIYLASLDQSVIDKANAEIIDLG